MAYTDKSRRGNINGGQFHMSIPRTHQNCREVFGVSRPGKTAADKERGHIPYRKNRRIYDDREKVWKKV